MSHSREVSRWRVRGLILLLLVTGLASLRGEPQGGGDIGVSLSIPLHVGFTTSPSALTFRRIRAPGVYVLQTPLSMEVLGNTHQAQLRYDCASPRGNLMTRPRPRREIPTFFLIAEDGQPPPAPNDPRWIPGSQLKGRIDTVDIFGEWNSYLFCKVAITTLIPGTYGDMWTFTLTVQGNTYTQTLVIRCRVG